MSYVRATAVLLALGLALAASPVAAQLVIFEAPGITLGDDPVECTDQGSYRHCIADADSERILSHDGLPVGDRIPISFQLYLPPAPASGPDGLYPLVVFIHGWGNSKTAPGGGLQSEFEPYAEGGYAVLAYDGRAWGDSCGAAQAADPACQGQWNHLADIRYEVRDAQYLAGLLADEPSDTGTPLVDPQRIGATGVSYGGGQSTMLTSLRDRVVNLDGSLSAWKSPAGKAMQIAAAAPYWAWTDLAYSLLPNGRTLDYVSNDDYRGPFGSDPFGVTKTSYVSGLFALGAAQSVYAPAGQDPDLVAWKATIDAGEPYTEATAGPIEEAISGYRSGYYWIDPAVAPAPTLFNSGWSDDIFPVSEPIRWIHRAKQLHGVDGPYRLVASDYGHARASGADAAYAKQTAREWFDHYLQGIGPAPGPDTRVRTQSCGGAPVSSYSAVSWHALSPGEVRLQSATTGTVLSSGGPSGESANAFDPIANGDPCARVADEFVAGTLVFDFPAPPAGGYTVLGSPTVIADISVVGTPAEHTILAARLLDVDAGGEEQLLARAVYRPDASGQQVFQLHPIGHHVADGHRLQLELLGNEAPTMRQSNLSFSLAVSNLDVRIPVAENPDGGQIQGQSPHLLPPGYLPEPGAWLQLAAGGLAVAGLAARRRARR